MIQIFLLLILSSVQPDADLYLSDDGKFSVIAPGVFAEKYQELETDMGAVEVFTLHCQPVLDKDPNFLYLINYYDYPEGVSEEDEEFINNLFDESIDQSITSLDGKLLYSSPITLQEDFDGRVNRVSYNKGASIVKSKMFLVEDRFYFLQVYTTKDNSLNLEMDEFLDSFKVLN